MSDSQDKPTLTPDSIAFDIEGVSGGYILTYNASGEENGTKREICLNTRKLMKRLQELLEQHVGNK